GREGTSSHLRSLAVTIRWSPACAQLADSAIKELTMTAATTESRDLILLSVRSALLVDELGGDVHGIGQRVPDGRLAVDGLLALADLLFGRGALDRHRVADVGDAVADGLVVTQHAA